MRFRRVVAGVLLPVYLTGCGTWKTQEASPQQVISQDRPDRLLVKLTSGDEVVVHEPRLSGDTLSGLHNDVPVEIPLAEISEVATEGTHAARTAGLAVGLVLGLAMIVGMVALSQMTAGLEAWSVGS